MSSRHITLEHVLYALALTLAIGLRFLHLGRLPLTDQEAEWALQALALQLVEKVQKAKGKLKFCCIDPDLRVIFKMTGLERMVEIYDDEQEALDSF